MFKVLYFFHKIDIANKNYSKEGINNHNDKFLIFSMSMVFR